MNEDTVLSLIKESILKNYLQSKNPDLLNKLIALGHPIPYWHFLMLQDKSRLVFYSNILKNRVKDKIVLDIGAGTGILSYLALQYGAKKVFSVEFNPKLQSLYQHFLEKYLLSGSAQLLTVDAASLTLDSFGHERPQVIVHEIFGADALSENVLPVFAALKNAGILDQCDILPRYFEIILEPVYSGYYADFFNFENFETFPLSDLSELASSLPLSLSDKETPNDWINSGDAKTLLKIDLMNPEIKSDETYKVEFELRKTCSHLRLSFKTFDEQGNLLNSSHSVNPSHWKNIFYPVTNELRSKVGMTVFFKVNHKTVQLVKFAERT